MEKKNPVVGIVMPLGSSRAHPGAVLAMSNATRGNVDYKIGQALTSILTFTFNTLWAGMLNLRKQDGITHLAMIHSDVVPAVGWLDVLMAEMMRLDAAVVSAVVPIKDERGLTSTALDVTGDPWMPRRLTMAEVYCDFPETFNHPDLLLNTGLWLCRFDEPWVEKVWFEQQDRIAVNTDGTYFAQTKSEDWQFSRRLRELGLGDRIYATRKVPLMHDDAKYVNSHPWGTWTKDEEGLAGAPVARPMVPDVTPVAEEIEELPYGEEINDGPRLMQLRAGPSSCNNAHVNVVMG